MQLMELTMQVMRQKASTYLVSYTHLDVYKRQGLAILSVMEPQRVALAISAGDHKAFKAANGVGPKLARCV